MSGRNGIYFPLVPEHDRDSKEAKTLEPVTVRGKVLDEKGMTYPCHGNRERTSIGGSTNDQGMFVFSLPKMDTIYLLVSFVGMETREVGITNFNQEVVGGGAHET